MSKTNGEYEETPITMTLNKPNWWSLTLERAGKLSLAERKYIARQILVGFDEGRTSEQTTITLANDEITEVLDDVTSTDARAQREHEAGR